MDVIRVVAGEQLAQGKAVRTKVFVEEQGVDPELELDEYDASPQACGHVLVQDDGQAVGAGRWRQYDTETAKLQRVAVLKPYRGTGIGKRIIAELEAWARESGMRYAMLDGQCHAEPFYTKLGYATISEPFEEAGIMHVRMRKRL